MTFEEAINKQLSGDEGRRSVMYLCPAGVPTIGVGHNLQARPLHPKLMEQIALGIPLSDAQIDSILQEDLAEVLQECKKLPCQWDDLSEARKGVLVNMVFNLGLRGVKGFKGMLSAIRREDWTAAKKHMLDSKWAKQVKGRAIRLARQMETDVWQFAE